ncbi:MAG TPA: nuclear transport factor 2 family protein [Chitinophagaceae bacterium]|nr:nuclear transport factor 2 family protein [Chitinophagaceae bacterium]
MKKEIVNGIVLSCMMLLMISCSDSKKEGNGATAIDKEQIKKEIQAKEDAFAELYNTGQLKDIGYYADDATTFLQNRPALVGKEAIIEFLKSDISSNTNKISFKTNEVFVSNDGNMVVEIGHFIVVDSTNTGINRGNYMSLFEKRNGKYVCVRDMSASDVDLSAQ